MNPENESPVSRARVHTVFLFVALATGLLIMSGCTQQQIDIWNGLNHDQQVAVGAYMNEQNHQPPGGVYACIRHHESDRGPYPHANGYRAENPSSTASGAYQFIDGTWRTMSARAGHAGWGHAANAPPWVQDAVAVYTVQHGGIGNWAGSGCG
jgi:hypothetical protein